MAVLEGTANVLEHSDEDDGRVELIYTDNNGSFATRRALEQFKGKNRQYGNAVCPECKQSFVNAARLERHLAVHQVFGAYLCPLCGKTYKYEYNLFFHWRKTCQYLNELIKVEQRKGMDVNSLRLLVDEVVVKRNETEPVDIGISPKALFQPVSQLELPIDPQSPLARSCPICGTLVHRNHLPQHEALHSATTETGLRMLDMQSLSGGYFCDLCGVSFRCRDSLYTHWRSSCAEIMANIEPGAELFLSDLELKAMVLNLLWRLRRVSHQSPLRAFRTKKECIEEAEPLVRFGIELGDPCNSNRRTTEDRKLPVPSSGDPEGNALVFMDDYANPADTVIDVDGELVNVVSVDRGKWNISEDGRPLECPDCFRQFANAGRLERHISGFHSHYGAFKCSLCGHRFKYDYNLLFHYRHSCAYTKLLVGADVRKLLDATSLRKLVSQIKESDPQLRVGSSRLINVRRRPALKAVPRNIRAAQIDTTKCRLKGPSSEGKKCPVCAPKLSCDVGEAVSEYSSSMFLSEHSGVSSEQDSAGEDAPPTLEVESPGEVPPVPTRCVDVNGEDIHDFDAEQLHELDVMLQTGQLTLGDLVIASSYGEDVEYRVAVGTRHGSQIVLEKKKSSETPENKVGMPSKPTVDEPPTSLSCSQNKTPSNDSPEERTCQFDDECRSNEETLEYVETGGLPQQYVEEGNEEMEYETGELVHYEMDDSEGHNGRRIVRFVDEEHLVEYLNDGDLEHCDGFVQYGDDENGQRVVEFVGNGAEMVQYLITENDNDRDVMTVMKTQIPSSAEGQSSNSNMDISSTHRNAVQISSAGSGMAENFTQQDIMEKDDCSSTTSRLEQL